jgi:acetyl-CoA carboxylase biotin carboxyl carrier protein
VTTSTSRAKKSGEEPASRPAQDTSAENISGNFLNEEIRELIKLVQSSDITELSIENGSQKILIKREKTIVSIQEAPAPARTSRAPRHASGPLPTVPIETPPIPDPGSPPEDSFHKIVAPMVGTYYRSPDPKSKPFVGEGEVVEKGQVIGIIEAMKIMNEIVSEHTGRCVKISVENGQPVEYGQTLLLLEPV